MSNTFYSPGKVILSGEHSVVHGYPAIVTQLPIGVTASIGEASTQTKHTSYIDQILEIFSRQFSKDISGITITVQSQLIERAGFGSSAAVAHAVFQALGDYFDITFTKEELFPLVLEAEKLVHGNPSGVDVAAVVHGGTLLFTKNPTPTWEQLQVVTPRSFLLVNSGKAEETTGEMVAKVALKIKTDPSIRGVLTELGTITKSWQEELATSTKYVFDGQLIAQNQKLLEKLGVVGVVAQEMIARITSLGGVAKVTGAGGVVAGSGWLLAYHPNLEVLTDAAIQNGWETQISTVQ